MEEAESRSSRVMVTRHSNLGEGAPSSSPPRDTPAGAPPKPKISSRRRSEGAHSDGCERKERVRKQNFLDRARAGQEVGRSVSLVRGRARAS